MNADGTCTFENVPPGKSTASAASGAAIAELAAKDPNAKVIEVKAGQAVEAELAKP